MELVIRQQFAKIGLDIREPQINLKTTKPVLQHKTVNPRLEMESPHPDLHIDQRVCYTSGLHMNPVDFIKHFAAKGYRECLEGTARWVQEGNRLAQIENPGALQDIVAWSEDKESEIQVVSNPSRPPEIRFDTYPVRIRYIPGKTEFSLSRGSLANNFQWGDVQVYLRQKNMIDISWRGQNVNKVV